METINIKNIAALRFLTIHIKFFYIISYLMYNNNNNFFIASIINFLATRLDFIINFLMQF